MDAPPPLAAATAAERDACAAWFGPGPVESAALPGTGFSGVPLGRVRPRGGGEWFVIKAFATGTQRTRVEWIHALVRHLAARVTEVPPPLATPTGATVVTDSHGVHWELVPFVAGAPAEAPGGAQAAAALDALARVHLAAAAWADSAPRLGPAPSVARRIARARDLLVRPWSRRRGEAPRPDDALRVAADERWCRAIALAESGVGMRAVAAVGEACVDAVPLQAVLGDVWSAHVLFAPDGPARVAGIVDLHAAAIDSPAADIARLLGSWRRDAAPTADPGAAWPEALAAYAAVRPLAPEERRLVPFLHAAGVVCSLDNWFRWLLEERRRFAAPAAVIARIERLLVDLPAVLDWLAHRGASGV